MNQSLEDIESTDGIDVHVQKCKIKDSEWESSSTELFENDCLLRLAEESNRMKAPKTSEIINDKYTFKAASYEKGNDTSPDDEIGESFVKSVSDNPLQSPETETSDSISVSIEGCENSSSKAKTDTSFIKKYSSQLKDKMDMPLDNTLSANIWDFGGQFIYYATHQIFHSRDAIYLLVFNLSEDFNESIIDKDFPERKESMRNCLKFWLDSIHAYAGSEEGLTFANVTKPIVILVGTFKDQFKGNLEEKLYDALEFFVDDLSARRHLLPEQYAVSTTDMSDNEIQKLKEKIYEIGIHHAERNRVPLKWIPLEIALLAEKSKNILTLKEVKILNLENENLVGEEELKTVLKYLHLKGTFIFFDEKDLEDHIVVNPQYLVDAFRCVIGSKSCIKDAKVHHLWNRLNETAILENDLLHVMWKKEVEKDFIKNKNVLLMFLQRHMILSKLNIMDEEGNMDYQEKYMIPSLLKHHCEQNTLKMFTDGKCATAVSLGFRIENSALLTNLFQRIIAGALGKWSPVEINKRIYVFQNIGHFRLDLEHVGKIELKPGKGIQLTVINQCPEIKVGSKICDYFRRYIESLIKYDFQQRRCHMYNSKPYKHYLACSDRLHDGNGSENTYDIDDVRNKERACCPDFQAHTIECKSAIDEWFPPGKITELYRIANRRITKDELSRVSGCIGHNWRLLGVVLGVDDINLDHLEMDYPSQTATCIYKMLCKWEQIKQDDATLLQLITCIEDNPVVNVNKDMIKNIVDGN
jgi:hypothetical protein